MTSIGLVTPTYSRDLELCAILCESVDRYVTSFSTHYLIVADDELALFEKFSGEHRRVLPISQLLPPWLKTLPGFIRRNNRRWWWSLRSKPISGWHTQQFVKIAACCWKPPKPMSHFQPHRFPGSRCRSFARLCRASARPICRWPDGLASRRFAAAPTGCRIGQCWPGRLRSILQRTRFRLRSAS
jgi:hypothetical protein